MKKRVLYKRYKYFNNQKLVTQRKLYAYGQRKRIEERVENDKLKGRISEIKIIEYEPNEITVKRESAEVKT